MIKFFKNLFGKMFKSLRAGMFFAIILSIVLAVSCSLITNVAFKRWIENEYNSEESKQERYTDYVEDLQSFVDKNKLSSNDTAEILDWVSHNRNIYLFIYKNDVLFFDSSIIKPDNDKNSTDNDGEKTDGDAESDEKPPIFNDSSEGENNGLEEGEFKEESGSGKEPEKENDSAGGGLTVQYPSREQIIESAKNNGQMPLEMSDGSLLVSIADFTEYIYYDVANIVSIIVGVLVLTIILMLYFQNILTKISALAKDVTKVYEVDMNTPIRTQSGNNELAELTRNVEEMRSSMMKSLEKEKEAINANTELITSMSHDIRTPLTILLGYLDIMKSSTEDSGMQEYIKASEVTAMRLKDLSDDMFRYFLVFGSGDIAVDLSEYSAKTLFDQLLSEHVLLLTEKGYTVSMLGFDKIDESVIIKTDAPKVMRIVDNVFSNIYKYADKNEKIVIEAGTDDGPINVSFSNKVSFVNDGAESNGVGLRTCKRLCEAIGAEFYAGNCENEDGVFVVKLKFSTINPGGV